MNSVRDWAVIAVAIKPAAAVANAAPTVSLTSPANGAIVTAPASIVLTADAQDSDGTVAQVEFFQGATLVATDTTASVTFTLTNVAAGSYTFTARATDNLGAATTSAAVSVTVNAAAQVFFIHADHLNTPRLITNQVGQAVWSWNNDDPFGNNVPNENPSGLGNFTCNLRLPGQYFDKETNLHYNYRRDYDPSVGRYIQSDPVGVKSGINTYEYAKNNPLKYVDPLGLCPCAGGIWDQEFGDSQASVAAGIYLSVARVNYTCRSNPSLKCSGRQSCIGGGPIVGGGLNFNISGTVYGTNDSNNLAGWSGSSAATSFFIFGFQFPIGAPGGNVGAGPSFGLGAAYINCYTDNLNCNCPQCEK